jgi:hypothetical protein
MPDSERYVADGGRVWLRGPGPADPRVVADATEFADAEKIADALNGRAEVERLRGLLREARDEHVASSDLDLHRRIRAALNA